jgi:hypothetical protein
MFQSDITEPIENYDNQLYPGHRDKLDSIIIQLLNEAVSTV